ncbi:hypothetical protein TREMEDRAFT_70705 [Tremella mesenterica DSM 1558]|uniref:uncharacterized protein n=1 Tax=Tremella mesenterica (strain ATCC 24925 / CBS 8224 / DSM 1558 / NBRC 9311 / NRRL Y-6157 / RJB 2259-6 / UBC 559-6) TaxID=578456 RepID=UPI0003F4A1D4|nr:uncharacterized protein TREMEDRAFT_70705 [Tremella mesenterica DSM 1558]EIW72382.1 hypothetical protein TREMEDRAFT_70705 [Tremella mesenterica DSM 1558]
MQNVAASSSNPVDTAFGSSIVKERNGQHKAALTPTGKYSSFIKPATPGAFKQSADPKSSKFHPQSDPFRSQGTHKQYVNGWPAWAANAPPKGRASPQMTEGEGEVFDLNSAKITADDYVRVEGEADAHMRELLSSAVGAGEGDVGDDAVKEGEDIIDGFAQNVRLMPHQVRGVRWMRGRETGTKTGGILADDMGLGKTVQTLARIVEGRHTPIEKKTWKAGTLIIAPLAVNEQWAAEIRTKTSPGLLKVRIHHGPSRAKTGKILESFDVVITTFQTLAAEHGNFLRTSQPSVVDSDSDSDRSIGPGRRTAKKSSKKSATSPLFETKWLRVNNVQELYSLFKFLRAKPLDDWDTFKRIVALVKDGRTKVAMKKLHVVLKAVMLRRAKDATIDGKPILNLPGRTVEVVACPFDSEERAFYEALEKQTALSFNKFLRSGTVMANFTSVLTMLLRLRQACNHPALVTKSLSVDVDALKDSDSPPNSQKPVQVVKDEADELADLLGGVSVASGKTCAVCFVKLPNKDMTHCEECNEIARKSRAQSAEIDDGLPPSSAKIRMMLKLLRQVEARGEGKEKTIVFSQFTSFFDLAEPFLKDAGINYVRYDGSMRDDKRQASLETIRSSSTVRVILISFKAGSTGLNLTCCNNVLLMDLWWNPALEDQAFDRAHRLGQTKDVNIYKLTIEETVEKRILELQDSKRELAKAALSGEGAKNLKLTLNDLMKLFKRDTPANDDSNDSDNSESD